MSSLLLKTRKYSDSADITPSFSYFKMTGVRKMMTLTTIESFSSEKNENSTSNNQNNEKNDVKPKESEETETVCSPTFFDFDLVDFEEVDDQFIL